MFSSFQAYEAQERNPSNQGVERAGEAGPGCQGRGPPATAAVRVWATARQRLTHTQVRSACVRACVRLLC